MAKNKQKKKAKTTVAPGQVAELAELMAKCMPVCHNHNCRKSGDASCDLKKCESCGMATYCSKKCQKNHLSVHKSQTCRKLKIGIFRDGGDKKLRFNVGGELFVRSIHNYRLIYVRVLNELLFCVSSSSDNTHRQGKVLCG